MYGLATNHVIVSVPLFIFMASLLERSGIARDMFDGLNVWLNRTRGGIAIMAIIMAAMSGIIGGEIVLLGLILGAIMDWVGIVLLVMPVFLPIVTRMPVEELGLTGALVAAPAFVSVWFGILFTVNMQVSFLSPPFGPAAFYLKSVAPPHISLPDIFRGFLPFIAIQLFVLLLILLVPEITMVFR